jgi:hypothetical protein
VKAVRSTLNTVHPQQFQEYGSLNKCGAIMHEVLSDIEVFGSNQYLPRLVQQLKVDLTPE